MDISINYTRPTKTFPYDRIDVHLLQGNKLQLIKLFKDVSRSAFREEGFNVMEAKNFVEALLKMSGKLNMSGKGGVS